jgi:hypothetical protein
MGKNFSCNNSKGIRKKSDFYETPYSITSSFLEREKFDYSLSILEPACGNNAIVKILEKYWDKDKIVANDLFRNGKDFLSETTEYNYIITNPPFSLAQEFILKAKEISKEKFCFLLPLSYLHGKSRYDNIWTDTYFPLAKVYIFTRYPLLGEVPRDDGKYHTGMMVYAWYVWDKYHLGEPTIDWIDNNSWILKKGEK